MKKNHLAFITLHCIFETFRYTLIVLGLAGAVLFVLQSFSA